MTKQELLSKTYEPNKFEAAIYELWEHGGVFNTLKGHLAGDDASAGPATCKSSNNNHFSILMPPLNANGNMHIGHSLSISLQDILCRHHRAQGTPTSYIPGLDHAGLETWVVFEKKLNEKGQSRFDFDRNTLYQKTWDFVEENKNNIQLQLRASGAGADWGNQFYTLDDNIRAQIYATFKQMWQDGLIYRGERIVNYSTKFQTGYADIEVDYKEEKGFLWDIIYDIKGSDEKIVVSTTRPETMLGDTAIAVNPSDQRYSHLVGQTAILPLLNREIPIVADDYVDAVYGTGAVKITPAHDPNDFEVGNRHNLPRITVIGFDGLMTAEAGQYAGLTVEKARNEVLKSLDKIGKLGEKKKIVHTVGYDYKSGLPIQPLLKEQWFIDMKPLAKKAIAAIKAKKIRFYPESRANVLISYLENLRDWNLSRQIPWGIPIPAFQNTSDPTDWIFDDRTDLTEIVADGKTYRRDEDVFDTWFSSGQLPLSVMPDGFTPISVMETGGDILFPWVSRMIMLSLYVKNQVPFTDVYLHGLVLDQHGAKMSKSKGNVINPMEVIEQYGSDALRMGLVVSRSAGQSQAFGLDKVISGRNLCNKLWNIAKFTSGILGEDYLRYTGFATNQNRGAGEISLNEPVENWIVARALTVKLRIDKLIADYRFAEAAEMLYGFIWGDVADWFIEAEKVYQNRDLLAWVLQFTLKLAHPFLPFVTEAIWQTLPFTTTILAAETWNDADFVSAKSAINELATGEFEQLKTFVSSSRELLANLPKAKYKLLYGNDNLIKSNSDLIKNLLKLESIATSDVGGELPIVVAGREAWLDVPKKVKQDYFANLRTKLEAAKSEIAALERRLLNPNYTEKAPAELVAETEATLKEKQQIVAKLQAELSQ